MSTETASFVLSLEDQMSSPAMAIVKSLGNIEKMMEVVAKQMEAVDKASGKNAKNTEKQAGAWAKANRVLGTLNHGLQLAKAAYGSLQRAVTKGLDFAGSFAGQETLETQLEIMTGSREAVRGLRAEAAKLGAAFGLGDFDVLDRFADLLGSGFSAQEVPVIFQALGDFSAIGGAPEQLLSMLNKAHAKERLRMTDIERITAASSLAISDVLDRMAEDAGMSRAQVMTALQSEDGIDPSVGIMGILSAVQDATGGPLGTAMQKQANTFAQQMHRMKSTWRNAIFSMDVGEMPGFNLLVGVLKQINDIMDPTAEGGKRLREVIKHLDDRLSAMFEAYSGEGGFEKLRDDLLMVVEAAGKVADKIFDIIEAVGGLAKVAAGAIAKDNHRQMTKGEKTFSVGSRVGAGAVMGAALGSVVPGVGTAVGAAVGAGAGLVVGLGRMGYDYVTTNPEDFADSAGLPKYATGGIVTKPTIALVGEAGPEAIVPLRSTGGRAQAGRGVTVHLTQHIQASEGMDPESLARLAAERAAEVLSLRLEGVALQAGAI